MLIYRAMCKEEYENTLKNGKPDFYRKFKWFGNNLEWIKSRVQDGKFNNSSFVEDRYEYLCEFEWDGLRSDFMSKNEIQFNVRKNPTIKFVRLVSQVTKGELCQKYS